MSEGPFPGVLCCVPVPAHAWLWLCAVMCMCLCAPGRAGGGGAKPDLPFHLAPLGRGTSPEGVVGGCTANVACF